MHKKSEVDTHFGVSTSLFTVIYFFFYRINGAGRLEVMTFRYSAGGSSEPELSPL